MGTHSRLGEVYSSRDGPCAVRLVAGHEDVLRQIAARVRNLPPRTLAPPDRETLRLRRLLWQLEQELHAERSASKELRVQLSCSERELAHSARREEGAAAAFARALELAHAMAEQAVRQLQKDLKQLKDENSALRSTLSAEQRAHRLEVAGFETDRVAELERHESQAVARLREQELELRQYQRRMFIERNEAKQRAEELALQTEKLSESLERVRGTSKNGLLAEVRAANALPLAS